MKEMMQQPLPWYVAGAIIGLVVPVLLILGNKHFGVSANFRHACAACIPGKISFFKYDWKKETWNLFFAAGLLAGGVLTTWFLPNSGMDIAPDLVADLKPLGINDFGKLVPSEIFSWQSLFSLRGFLILVGGGFLVGFGSRYAGGCTSGHSIMGLSNLQWPSLVATTSFMLGGYFMTNFILPVILRL
ncbi:MAG: YeeE/YedE family protein [Chitinophagaceae bacterium]|nr:YeeE/YedE family protein [Chitinophagaceae bacterium]